MTPSAFRHRHWQRAASCLLLVAMVAACDASTPTATPSTAPAGGGKPRPVASGAAPAASAPVLASLPPIGDVPAYKADAARSGVTPGPDIASQPVVAWETNLGCAVSERAVVIGDGIVVVGCNDPRLFGLDARTGAVRWKADISAATLGSAAIADGRVFISTGGGDVEARSLQDGTKLWAKSVDGTANPIVIDNVLYAGTQAGVLGLNVADGSTAWTYATDGPAGGTVIDGIAYVNAPGGEFRAVEMATGSVLWKYRVRSATATSPVITADTVFIGARQEATDPEGELYALDRRTGKRRWSIRSNSGYQVVPAAVINDTLLARTEDQGLLALDTATGKIRWNAREGSGFAPVSTTGGVAYATQRDEATTKDQLLALDTSEGKVLWRLTLDGQPAAVPVASGGMLFLGDSVGNVSAFAQPELVALLRSAIQPGSSTVPTSSPVASAVPALLGSAGASLGGPELALSMPTGMDVGPDGNVYLVNARSDEIVVIAPDGSLVRRWGESGSGPGQLEFQRDPNPAAWDSAAGGAAVAPDGTVYVTDSKNYRIQAFTPTGDPITMWGRFGEEDGQFLDPIDVDVAPDGLVYVVDDERDDIQVFTPKGKYVRTVGEPGSGPGELNYTASIHVGSDGTLYNADWGNSRVQAWDADGVSLWSFGRKGGAPGQFQDPRDVATGADGTVYVADHVRVQAIRNGTELVGSWTSPAEELGSIQVVGDQLWVSAPWEDHLWRVPMTP